MKRRVLLIAAAFASEGGVGLVGCGGGSSGQGDSVAELSWSVYPRPILAVGLIYDLKQTLPTGVRGDGNFAVDPRGAPLPGGITLSSDGMLSATAQAAPSDVDGVVFIYEEADG